MRSHEKSGEKKSPISEQWAKGVSAGLNKDVFYKIKAELQNT